MHNETARSSQLVGGRPGAVMRRASTPEERSAAARALLERRARTASICEFCGATFETYAYGTLGVGRFCSTAHQRRAYYRTHRDQERQRLRQWRARRRAVTPTEPACKRCGTPLSVPDKPRTGPPRLYC